MDGHGSLVLSLPSLQKSSLNPTTWSHFLPLCYFIPHWLSPMVAMSTLYCNDLLIAFPSQWTVVSWGEGLRLFLVVSFGMWWTLC